MTLFRSAVALSFLVFTQAAQAPLPPPPGVLVDIGGRKLHLLCSGSGASTVVFVAGASSFAIDWTLVQREISKTNRACSYDVAGMGWSDPRTTGSGAADLHALLSKAGERGPFILVGASRGGLLVRAYLAEYPDAVAGFVFVDPSSEDRLFTQIGGEMKTIASVTAEELRQTFPTKPVSVPRRSPQTGAPFDRLPPDLYQTRIKLDERLIAGTPETVPASVVAESRENERAFLARLLATRTASAHPFGDRPTVVLSRGDERNAGREQAHATLASLSTNSRHTVVVPAGHEIHLFDPPAVVQAVQDVVHSVRTKSRLPPR